MPWSRPTCSSAAPARRRSRRRPPSGLPMIVVPYPARGGATSRPTRASWSPPAPRGSSRTSELRRRALRARRRDLLADGRRWTAMGAASRGARRRPRQPRRGPARPGRRRPLPSRHASSLARTAAVERLPRGQAADGRRSTIEPPARRLTEDDALRLGTDIQRRLGVKTSRDEPLARFTTMRVGGRPTSSPRCATCSSCAPSCASRARRDVPAVRSSAAARTWSSAMPASAAWWSWTAPSSERIEGDRLIADAGLPMAKAATLTQGRGPVRARVRAGHPGHRGWRRLGQRRRARIRRARACS